MVQQDHFMYILLYCSRKLLQPVKINFGQLQRTWLHVIFFYIKYHCYLALIVIVILGYVNLGYCH